MRQYFSRSGLILKVLDKIANFFLVFFLFLNRVSCHSFKVATTIVDWFQISTGWLEVASFLQRHFETVLNSLRYLLAGSGLLVIRELAGIFPRDCGALFLSPLDFADFIIPPNVTELN